MADISAIKLPNNTILNLKDSSALAQLQFTGHELLGVTRNGTTQAYDLGEFDTLSVTDLNAGNLIVTGAARFTNAMYGNLAGNAETATTLATGRTIQTNLASTSAATFDGSANITPGITGTLGVGNGGTGQTSAVNAANSFINSLTTGDSTPQDNDYYISQYVNGGTSTTTYHRRKHSALWAYIKSKADPVYATAAQGTLATNAMPKSGGTFTGAVTLNADPTANLGAATKQYVDTQITNHIAASDAMVFKGTIGTGGTVTSLPTSNVVVGDTYKCISAISLTAAQSYTGAAVSAKIGDLIVAMNGSKWIVVPSGDETVTTIKYSTTTQTLTTSAQSGAITVGEAATKQVVTSIDTSAKLPTANAVKTFVEGKNYVPTSGTGATGTWGISISGNATTATTATTATSANKANITTTANAIAKYSDTSGTFGEGPVFGSSTTTYLRNDGSWETPTDTKYTAGTGLSLSAANAFSLTTSGVTAGSAGPTAAVTGSEGTTVAIPRITVDQYGRVTALTSYNLTNKNTTYGVVSKSAAGLTPQLPNETTTTKYLRQDGTWVVPPNDNTHNIAYLYAGASNGSANEATTNGNTYLIIKDGSSVSSRNKITGTGATSVTSDANGVITINSTNTWTAMTGATSSANGTVGYINAVPPKDGYNTKYLRADGTWSVPPNDNTDSWRAIQVNGTQILASNVSTALNLKAGSNISISNSSGTVTIAATDTTYTAATAAPGKVASTSSAGTSVNYARQDHTHGIDLASGDANGQVKIAGSNVNVTGLKSAAYTESSAYATAAQGTTAENALPKTGGTMTGGITMPSDSSGWNTKGIIFSNGSRIGENTSGGLGIYAAEKLYLRPNSGTAANTADGVVIDGTGLYPSVTNTENLGGTSNKWANIYSTAGTFSGAVTGTSFGASGYLAANTSNSGTAGGIALYGTTPTQYGIAMRNISNGGKHGYVNNDWATYFYMQGTSAANSNTRGWIFKNTTNGNAASISGAGNAVFNGSVTVGGNVNNDSGMRMEYDATLGCTNFIFN